jgi:hypothetical protein
MSLLRTSLLCLLLVGLAGAQGGEDNTDERLQALEQGFQSLAQDVERFDMRDVVPPLGASLHGMGPAASKVYFTEAGQVSIGGYGEFRFQGRAGETDVFDALRAVTYIGVRFDEQWVFNSELEFEHGSTSSSSGTTTSGGSTSAEFAYVEYEHSDNVSIRGGLLLIPVGLTNEMHEPTTFLPAARPQTESRIIPTTWREMGIGTIIDAGGMEYKAYVVNGLNGSQFDASGLRSGRQKGNRAAAEDFAIVLRGDWTDTPGMLIGASVYHGDSGNGAAGIPDLTTTIVEVHGTYEDGPWRFRALAASADVDDAAAFNVATGENLGDSLEGWYAELGYNVLADCSTNHALTPYVRIENIDTNAGVPTGFVADPTQDDEIKTVGIAYQPNDHVILKLDYDDWDGGTDTLNFLIGYVF